MEDKLIKVDDKTHEIIRRESIRQSMKPYCVVSMKEVIRQWADRCNKKYKLLK